MSLLEVEMETMAQCSVPAADTLTHTEQGLWGDRDTEHTARLINTTAGFIYSYSQSVRIHFLLNIIILGLH